MTSGADNLEKSLHFYQDGLGLPTEGTAGTDLNMAQLLFLTCKRAETCPLGPKNIAHESNVTLTAPSPAEFT